VSFIPTLSVKNIQSSSLLYFFFPEQKTVIRQQSVAASYFPEF
jgi:hypothetical protein